MRLLDDSEELFSLVLIGFAAVVVGVVVVFGVWKWTPFSIRSDLDALEGRVAELEAKR